LKDIGYKLIYNFREVIKMPGGDRTGPAGLGSMTGRSAGYCAGYGVPGYMNPTFGRGFRRLGGGRGHRNWFYATGLTGWQRAAYGYPAGGVQFAPVVSSPSREDELNALKEQSDYFNNALGEIKKRIEELESEKKEK